ncbi:MAG TPA: biopolymer transporter ExbD [candidate division WOR-3 bacterium]|uniref:Biopolymer transporter ExbD n=1 Tax=candidate division WOR-3 bacterium TaxID=2052148 RepID=A0A7V0XG45_UNCW3|nr:biopolymer transporter ExbD [candidate division WOR-3 bacterium]
MKRITQRRERGVDIPTASTGDIAFLLIIFFMVSTVFRKEVGLQVILPQAAATERLLRRRNVASVWLDARGNSTIDDNLVTPELVTVVMAEKVLNNPDLVVSLQVDREVDYGRVNDVLEALKEARALKVTFATEYLEGG